MKNLGLFQTGTTITVFCAVVFFMPGSGFSAAESSVEQSTISFAVQTFDGLEFPAQVVSPQQKPKKMVLFINGSTPYDEKGNIGAMFTDDGQIVSQKHQFYLRLLDVLPAKGYAVATMAKRSFVYPQKLPRPSLDDLAMDIVYLIRELKNKSLLADEKDLVIIGYSEGSIVATKVLGLLKKQPDGCILLGSGTSAHNYKTQTWREWYMTDVIRKLKGWTDDQLKTEYEQFSDIMNNLIEIDENTFENEMKINRPHGFGFAQWESYYIDRETIFYDSTPNLLESNIPLLICIGEDDISMPLELAKRTYDRLVDNGYVKATFRSIEDEVHSYNKYDVFAIIDAWITSGWQSTEIVLDETDKRLITEYAKKNELISAISSLPWEGAESVKILDCYRKAKADGLTDSDSWFKLGLLLFGKDLYDESLDSFNISLDPDFMVRYASMTWIGHLNDLRNNRTEAVVWYKKALDNYPGFPVQHDNWEIVLDKKWIEDRLEKPFAGVK